MIPSRQLKLSAWLRICAGLALVSWLAAWIVCTTECHTEAAEHMDQASAANGPSHDSDKNEHHNDSFCVSLHSLCPPTHQPVLTKPDFSLAFTLPFLATVPLDTLAQTETPISRQSPDRQFVFTPEVCLGPAFHSLAPPVLA